MLQLSSLTYYPIKACRDQSPGVLDKGAVAVDVRIRIENGVK